MCETPSPGMCARTFQTCVKRQELSKHASHPRSNQQRQKVGLQEQLGWEKNTNAIHGYERPIRPQRVLHDLTAAHITNDVYIRSLTTSQERSLTLEQMRQSYLPVRKNLQKCPKNVTHARRKAVTNHGVRSFRCCTLSSTPLLAFTALK